MRTAYGTGSDLFSAYCAAAANIQSLTHKTRVFRVRNAHACADFLFPRVSVWLRVVYKTDWRCWLVCQTVLTAPM